MKTSCRTQARIRAYRPLPMAWKKCTMLKHRNMSGVAKQRAERMLVPMRTVSGSSINARMICGANTRYIATLISATMSPAARPKAKIPSSRSKFFAA